MASTNDHLQYRSKIESSIRYTKYFLIPITIALLGLIAILAYNFLDTVEEKNKSSIHISLNTVANSTRDAINIRLYELQEYLKRFQKEPELIELVKKQLNLDQNNPTALKESTTLRQLQAYFEKNDFFKGLGFFIISKDNINLASKRYVNVGDINLIAQQQPTLLKKVFDGETILVPPIISDVPLEDTSKRLIENTPTMFIVTPLFENGKILTALAFRINTEREFSKISTISRLQPFNNTYVFDRRGNLLNKADPFNDFFSPNQTQSFPPKLTLPGQNSFTKMTQKAVHGDSGYDLSGYSDFRGKEVLGSWIWDKNLELGFATEIEKEVALDTYITTRNWVIFLYLFTTVVCLGTLTTSFISSNRTFSILQGFNQELKNNIEQKTKDLSQANISLQKAKELAEQANNTKSIFLSNMSHELRTPLNAVLGFTQILQIDENTNEDQKEVLEEITNAGKLLLGLINEILDLSSIELGKLNLNFETINIGDILEKSISLIQPLAIKKNIVIKTSINSPNTNIYADAKRMHQIFVNLLSNAIKYNHEGGKIWVKMQITNRRLSISIIDTGFGIPADKQELIFKPFNRIQFHDREIEGTGIGLAITKQLVEQQKGRIKVESLPGQGSTFIVSFPVSSAGSEATKNGDLICINEFRNQKESQNQQTVLLIEDNPANKKLFERMFKKQKNINFVSKRTAEDGLNYLNANPVDLILMDINLPGISGYEALKAIKNSGSTAQIPVVAVTANAMKNDIEKGLSAGFVDYICKPVDVISFMNVVNDRLSLKNNE